MADTPTPETPSETQLVVDGEAFTADDLTFREQRDMRRVLKDELMDDPTEDVTEANISDFYLAMIYVIKRRQNADLKLDDVLDLKLSDFLREVPPTKPSRGKAKA